MYAADAEHWAPVFHAPYGDPQRIEAWLHKWARRWRMYEGRLPDA